MLVLLAGAALGAYLYGPPGAIGGYVVGMLVSAFLPGAGGSCAVEAEPTDAAAEDESTEQDADAA